MSSAMERQIRIMGFYDLKESHPVEVAEYARSRRIGLATNSSRTLRSTMKRDHHQSHPIENRAILFLLAMIIRMTGRRRPFDIFTTMAHCWDSFIHCLNLWVYRSMWYYTWWWWWVVEFPKGRFLCVHTNFKVWKKPLPLHIIFTYRVLNIRYF